jgi:hypothetical protein
MEIAQGGHLLLGHEQEIRECIRTFISSNVVP